MSNSVYVGCVLYICPPAGCLRDKERKTHLSGGKETLVAQLWHRCSKMLYRLLTHTNRHLHKASCSASVAFGDATVNCLSSLFSQSFCPSTPLLIPASSCSVAFPSAHQPLPPFSSFIKSPSQRFLIFHATIITPLISSPLCPWVTDMFRKAHYSKVRVYFAGVVFKAVSAVTLISNSYIYFFNLNIDSIRQNCSMVKRFLPVMSNIFCLSLLCVLSVPYILFSVSLGLLTLCLKDHQLNPIQIQRWTPLNNASLYQERLFHTLIEYIVSSNLSVRCLAFPFLSFYTLTAINTRLQRVCV